MHNITLYMRHHKGSERIFASFTYNTEINTVIKNVAGVKWSSTLKSWHIPATKEIVKALAVKTHGIAQLNVTKLRQQLLERKQLLPVTNCNAIKPNIASLSPENKHALFQYVEMLKLKGYSSSTIKTYRNEFFQLLKELKQICVNDLQPEHLRRYFLYCHSKGLSENTLHSRLNAIKYYYEQVLQREKFFWEIPRPKKAFNTAQSAGRR